MRVEYYRFLLSRVNDPELPFEDEVSRDQVIAEIFSEGEYYEFKSSHAQYGFVIKGVFGKKVHARVGKRVERTIHSPPAKKFQEQNIEDWPCNNVFINLDDEKKTGNTLQSGQVIAIQINTQIIPNANNCLETLATKINEKIKRKGFYMSINPILEERKKFWAVVDANKVEGIKKVVLSYTPPNLFDSQNKLEDDLRESQKTYNTTNTQVVMENPEGELRLPKNNEFLKQSAEYIDNGGGRYTIYLKRGRKIIKSQKGVRSEKFEGIEAKIEDCDENTKREIINNIFGGEIK